MNQEIAKVEQPGFLSAQTEHNLERMLALGKVIIKSGIVPKSLKEPEQIVVVIATARELGIPDMIAVAEAAVINGKASWSAKLLLGLAMQRIPGFKHEILEETKEVCRIRFSRPGKDPYECTFTAEEAAEMGIDSTWDEKIRGWKEKPTWRGQKANMLYNRCVTKGLRRYCPDLTLPYSTEEMQDVVEIEAAPSKPKDLMPKEKMILPPGEGPFGGSVVEKIEDPDSQVKVGPAPAKAEVPRRTRTAPSDNGGAVDSDGPTFAPDPDPNLAVPPAIDFPKREWRKICGMSQLLNEAKTASLEKFWTTISSGKDASGKPYPTVESEAQAEERIDYARTEGRPAKFIYVWSKNAIQNFRPKKAAEAVKAIAKAGNPMEDIEQALTGGEDIDLWILRDLDLSTVRLEKVARLIASGKTLEQAAQEVIGAPNF